MVDEPPKKTPPRKRAAKRTTRRTPAARETAVVTARAMGKPFAAIAKQLRIRDVAATHALYERALERTLPVTPEQQRRTDLARIRDAETEQWPAAEAGDLAAIATLVDLELQRRHLLQGDVPVETNRKLGPIETATKGECDRLRHVAPALAATALVLARVVDEHTDEPGATATAARELRMQMSQLRGLAGTAAPPRTEPQGDPDDGGAKQTGRVVVPPTELEQLRRRAAERAGHTP